MSFNLNNYKIVMEFVADLDKIGTPEAKEVIEAIDIGAHDTDWIMKKIEKGMRLIFNHSGFYYYMKYENSFGITIFWREEDELFYKENLKKFNFN